MKGESSERARYRLLPLLIFATAAVALATWYLLINSVKQRLVATTGEGLALAAADIADKLDLFLFERFGDISTIASAASLHANDLGQLASHLDRTRETYRVYQWLAATDAQGRIVASTDRSLLHTNQSETDWFRAGRDSPKIYVKETDVAENGTMAKAVIFANGIRDDSGRFIGVAVIRSGLPAMDSLFETTTRSFQSLTATKARIDWQIATSDGRLIHDSRSGAHAPTSPIASKSHSMAEGPGWFEADDADRHVPVVTGYAPTSGHDPFPGLGWSVMVRSDRADVLHSMQQVLRRTFLGGLGIMLPVFGLAAWMVRRLRREWDTVAASEAHLITTLRSMAEGVIITDATGRVTMLNRAAETLTGWKERNAKGLDSRDVIKAVEPTSRKPIEPLVDEVLRKAKPIARLAHSLLLSRDGTERIISQSAAPIPGATEPVGAALIFHDVTERELGEAALRASQETFRIITENMTDIVTLHDLEGRAVFQSRNRFSKIDLLDRQIQSEPFGYVVREDRANLLEYFHRIIETGEPQRAEYRVQISGGAPIVVESVGTLIRRADGTPDRVLAVSRDITERRQTEEKLRSEKEFSDSLLASLPGVFFICNSRRRILRWNRNFEIVVGCSPEEIADLDLLAFFPPQEQQHVQERLDLCLSEGKSNIETSIWHRNGRLTAHYISGLRSEVDGQPAMLGIGIDISGRKAAEEALLATSSRLERQNAALGEQARNPALRGENLDVAFQTITEVASRTLGVSRASIWFYQGDDHAIRCEDLFDHPTGHHAQGAVLREIEYPRYFAALKEGRVIPAHYARTDPRTKDFTEPYLKPIGITSMLDAPVRLEGRVIGIICHEHTGSPREWTLDEQNFAGSMADLVALSLEVWQRRQAERAVREARDQLEMKVADRTRELSEANERLKELDRLKSEFLATMSHELRTPMNSIIGFTGILRQGLAGPLNDEQKKQLGMVHLSARHLMGLINDVLDLSRIESGKMETHFERFAVAPLVNEVVDSLRPIFTQKGLRVEVESDDPSLEAVSDRKKVFQVLLNLVNNAVKFTDSGAVKITICSKPGEVLFNVIDTGIGIKPEQLANLFTAFRQVDGSARRIYEGTGLGLYLSKKLVSMLGGSIGAESEFGAGSRFYFSIPRGTTTQEQ